MLPLKNGTNSHYSTKSLIGAVFLLVCIGVVALERWGFFQWKLFPYSEGGGFKEYSAPEAIASQGDHQRISSPIPDLYIHKITSSWHPPFYVASHEEGPPFVDGDMAQSTILEQLDLWARCREDPSLLVVDVGGYLGDFGLRAAACGCRTVIFEVQPQMLRYIRASVMLNGFEDDRVRVVPRAIGEKEGEKVEFSQIGGSTFQGTEKANLRGKVAGRFIATTTTLDAAFPTERIFFLKIDTEGNEPQVLQSAQRLLRDGRITHAVLEYTAWWSSRGDQHGLLPKLFSYHPRGLYALHRREGKLFGPVADNEAEKFYHNHVSRHLQTDIYAVFGQGQLPTATGKWTGDVYA